MIVFFSPDFGQYCLFPAGCFVDVINLCNCIDVWRQSWVSKVGITVPPVLSKGCFWSQGTAGGLGSFDTCGEVGSVEELWPSKAFSGQLWKDERDCYNEYGVRPQRVAGRPMDPGHGGLSPWLQHPGGGMGFPACSLPGPARMHYAYSVKRPIYWGYHIVPRESKHSPFGKFQSCWLYSSVPGEPPFCRVHLSIVQFSFNPNRIHVKNITKNQDYLKVTGWCVWLGLDLIMQDNLLQHPCSKVSSKSCRV